MFDIRNNTNNNVLNDNYLREMYGFFVEIYLSCK